MIQKMISLVYFFLYLADSCTSELYNPLLNLPAGEYKIHVKAIENNCIPPVSRIGIVQNIYIITNSANKSEARGNVTLNIPFDDSLDLEMSMAIKDSKGQWNNNAFVFKNHKACSTSKFFLGGAWTTVLNGLGVINTSCPLREGFYRIKGTELSSLFQKHNFAKSFFYGSYKIRTILYNKKESVFCIKVFIDIKRP